MFSLFIFVTFIMYVILLYAFTTPFLNKVFLELYECCEYVIESWEVQSSCSLTFTDIGNDIFFINIFSLEKVALLPLLEVLAHFPVLWFISTLELIFLCKARGKNNPVCQPPNGDCVSLCRMEGS